MRAAPLEIDGAPVLLYSVIDERHRSTGACAHIIEGVRQPSFPGLAICQYPSEDAVYLFYCDENWEPVTDTLHQSVDDAKRQAEFEFEGVGRTWKQPC